MTVRANGVWQGMNWIRQEKRLAIYLRDGCACVWCGDAVETGAQLTLDHLVPAIKGGSNHESNLVTACARCNSSRGARSVKRFAEVTAAYLNHGLTAEAILKGIRLTVRRSLDLISAKALIASRGSAFAALQKGN